MTWLFARSKFQLRKNLRDFYLTANCTNLENILFAKMLLSYVANLRLQNGTNIDHVRLETEVQQFFKKDPIKIFKAS